ncbi:MAG TPA: efflux RND transporter periplasmic adaptor subunit [Usitatibacter sp.]|nr:efflux RND transporter periplasmic adaptor subunit [Usitatibacter sp.]
MRKAVVGTLALVSLVAVGAVAYWAGSKSGASAKGSPTVAAPAKGPPPGLVVEAARVATVKLPQSLSAVGSLRSDETIIVRPEIAGRVAQILFREGQHVAKGTVLVRLDDSVQRADLDKARANLVLSKSKLDRALGLRQQGFVSGQATDEAENLYKVARADVELMEARVSKATITAPFAGTIGLRQVSIGDYVKEGQDIVNLESLDPLKVDFRVPEMALSQVKSGQTLQVTLDAIPDRAFDGHVYAINPLIDAGGRSIVIRAQVSNRDGKLRPGMFARVRLFTSEARDSAMVPEEAIFPVGDDKYVWKVVDGKVSRQKVEIGQRRDGRVEITSGLGGSDVVVTAGHLKVRDGMAVKVADTPGSAPQPALIATPPKTKG